MTHVRKALVFAFGVLVFVALGLGAAGHVAATQGAPSWSTGNQWVYTPSSGNGTQTYTVQEQTTLTIGSGTYSVWHVLSTAAAGSFSLNIDMYLTTDGLKVAKTSSVLPFVGQLTVTNDPPIPQMVFPMSTGTNWQGSSQVTTVSGLGSSTTTTTWSGTVTGETSVTVTAGTFNVAVIRSPSSGSPYTLNYYSDTAGWMVKTESYNSVGTMTSSQSLTSYKYSGNSLLFLLLIVGVVVIIAAAAAVMLLRRRPRAPMPMPPGMAGAQQPGYPPQPGYPSQPGYPPPPQAPPGQGP